MRNKIISLCMFVLSPKNNYHWLIRIADWKDGTFHPNPYNPDMPEEESNFEWLFFPESRAVGLKENSVGMFEWEYYQSDTTGKWRQDPVARPDLAWTEVLWSNCEDTETLCRVLRRGTDTVDGTHDILYIVNEIDTAYECLLWHHQDMRLVRSGTALTETCKKLDRYLLPKRCVATIRSRMVEDVQLERYYCTDLEAAINNGFTATLPRNEVLHQIVKDSLAVYPQGRSKRMAVKQVFAHLDDVEIEQKFANETGISLEEARAYILFALQRGDRILDIDQGDDRLYQVLIENDAVLAARMGELVKIQWERDHREHLKQAQEEEELLIQRLDKLREEEQICKSSIVHLTANIQELEKKLSEQRQLEEKLNSKLRQQMDAYRSDLSQLLCEFGLVNLSQKQTRDYQTSNPLYIPTTVLEETLMGLDCEKDVIEELVYNLGQAGISDRDEAELLSQYLLAAYHGRNDLFLVGAGGEAIADALCAVLFGKDAAVLRLSDTLDPEQIRVSLGNAEERVIYVEGLFSGRAPDVIFPLLQRYPDRQFLIGVPLADELRIEPKGLYSYALPLDCDYFVRSEIRRAFGYGNGAELLKTWEVSEGIESYAVRFLERTNEICPLIPKQKAAVAQILGRIPEADEQEPHQSLSSDAKRIGILACLLPMMRCCGDKDAYQAILQMDNVLKERQKERVAAYIESVM